MSVDVQSYPLPQIVTAIGGLGTAAFGLLEAIKPLVPAINKIGFARISETVSSLTPNAAVSSQPANALPQNAQQPLNALPQKNVLQTLLANWVNGTDIASQKAIAKTLIKMHLSPETAETVARVANVDADLLKQVATNIISGESLTQAQSDAHARFDLIVTATLDDLYQYADQVYRNWTRGLAALIAVGLAVAGGYNIETTGHAYWGTSDMWLAILVGLLATPLAPIAKDLSTALTTAVNTMQLIKK